MEEIESVKKQNKILKIVIVVIVVIVIVAVVVAGGLTYSKHREIAAEQQQQQVAAEKKKERLMLDKNMLHGASQCPVTEGIDSVKLGDNGKSLTYSRDYNYVNGFDCVAEDIEVPDSIKEEIESTTILSGRQTDDWGDFHVSWIAHGPGVGMTVTFSLKQNL
ncbi:hypothetical protein PT279_09185 [Bifidobacterium sp. ESL0784]|uniref:hypothetical protein n=1 Tax=Bifidobacterium sp. ESL0784 TaxID=2983231 RepID=UPI0023F89EB9|nr:hypothetical protein [Bifidobacterium sp. ESL0784]MDF7641756.1 hypothetical protein [Bifidobacterium sp. ESL0784]